MGLLGVDVDVYEFVIATVLLVITGGTAYLLGQKFGCQYARLFQGLLMGFLGFALDSGVALIYAFIDTILGITDVIAEEDPSLAFLDPSLAG